MSTHRFKVGDRLVVGDGGGRDGWQRYEGKVFTATRLDHMGKEAYYDSEELPGGVWDGWVVGLAPIGDPDDSPVEHPKHYNSHPSGVECITIARHHNFNIGNAFKYLWRIGLKGEDAETKQKRVQEIDKAIFCLQDERARTLA